MLACSKLQTIIWTSRMVEARHFYGELLGLRLKGKSHGALVFDVGGADLCVSPVPLTQPTAHTVLGFSVADLAGIVSLLTRRGVSLERIAGLRHDTTGVVETPEGAKVAWLRDPDGNLLSIVQYT